MNTNTLQKKKNNEESKQFTWIALLSNIRKLKAKLPLGYSFEPLQEEYKSSMSELYSVSYLRSIVKNLTEAEIEIERDFRNEYGKLDYSASFLIFQNNIALAAIFVVEQAPWKDTPSGPFITQLMVHPDHRKLGLAQNLLKHSANILVEKGAHSVALRVMSDNKKAINLYRKCGFASWDGTN